jgi:hypothetical protein
MEIRLGWPEMTAEPRAEVPAGPTATTEQLFS